jgi:hypothetical protein
VEYPKQLEHEMTDCLGPLVRARARKYGRTLVAVYAAPALAGEEEDGEGFTGALGALLPAGQ